MTRDPATTGRIALGTIFGGGVVAILMVIVSSPMPILLDLAFVAHLAGMLAGYLVAVLLVLMSRIPVLERDIGADRMARWHARIGRFFVALMLLHVIAVTTVWVSVRQDTVLGGIAYMMGLPWLGPAAIATVLFLAIGALSIRAARRRLSYETWHTIHLLTYVAIALSFGHELAGPNLAGYPMQQVLWSLLYAYAFAMLLRYRVLRPLERMWRHRLRVEQVRPEASGVVSVVLRGSQVQELDAEAGQFFRWRFLTRRSWLSAHPFSLSAPPVGDLLRITIKDLGSGSRALHDLRPGTLVLAEGPYGAMTKRRRTRRSVLLIAGGVGITPMRALFETIDVRGEHLTLLYRASSPSDIVFQEELEHIAAQRGAQIIWLIGRSSDPSNVITAQRLTALVPDVAERDVYLCASPALGAAAREALIGAGLPKRHLHEEVFAF